MKRIELPGLALVGTCLLAGCGSSGPVCHPVRGQVLYDNISLAEAVVVFHPVATAEGQHFPKPLGQTDAQGTFLLTTLQSNDGAPPGEYLITVELRELRQVGEESVRDGWNVLPPRYSNPQQSGLRYTVVEGENSVPPLELSAR